MEDLTGCDPSATLFPAGALFIGESAGHAESPGPSGWVIPGDAAPGRLLSFMERTSRNVSVNDPHWRAVKVGLDRPFIITQLHGHVSSALWQNGVCGDLSEAIRPQLLRDLDRS